MPTRTEPKAIASRCLAAWSSGDLDTTRSLVTHVPAARIPTAGWYRVRDGKIASVRAFFDPRPLTSAS